MITTSKSNEIPEQNKKITGIITPICILNPQYSINFNFKKRVENSSLYYIIILNIII